MRCRSTRSLPLISVLCFVLPLPNAYNFTLAAQPDRDPLTPRPRPFATLADRLPDNARLFCELMSVDELLASPAGRGLAEMFDALLRNVHEESATQPSDLPWQVRVAGAVGVRSEQAAGLLLDGPIALAAEGWSGLDDLILLSKPRDPAALEAVMESKLVPSSDAGESIRRYSLEGGYELACQKGYAIVGLRSRLYKDTLSLWSGGGNTLATDPLFYQLSSELPPGAQLMLYVGTPRVPGARRTVWPASWAENLPELDGLSAGLLAAPRGMVIEIVGHIQPEAESFRSLELSVEKLNRLPVGTVAAWTSSTNYNDLLLRAPETGTGINGMITDLLTRGWAPGLLERRLFSHLVGQSLFLVGRRPIELPAEDPAGAVASGPAETSPATASAPATIRLWLPTVALAVETDDPHAVENAMQQLAVNLLLQVAPEGDAQLIPEPLPGGGELQRVELGESLLADGRPRFLAHLRPCWAVVDRWLVVATDPDWLRDIVAGWRGIEPVLVAPGLHEQVRQVQSGGGAAMTVVTAHPRLAAEMSDSWLTYLQREHSDLLSSTWWEGLRRRHSRGRVQLGFLAGRSASNELVVERTVEGAPAHLRLMPGDRILGVEGEPLDRTGPADSLRELIDRRKRSDRVALDIMRHGEALRIELNLPRDDVFPFQPAELLRRLSRLCENVSIARYAEWRPSRNLLHARLEVQFAEP